MKQSGWRVGEGEAWGCGRSRRTRGSGAVALAVALAWLPAEARATEPTKPAEHDRLRGFYTPLGALVALGWGGGGRAWLGAEQSLVFYGGARRPWWGGGYVDARYDLRWGRARFGVGPEVGWGVFGFDGGLVTQIEGARVRHGVEARVVLTVGLLAVFGRGGALADGGERFGEAGLLVKFPFAQATAERR